MPTTTLFEAGFHNKEAFDAKVARCVNVMAAPEKTDIMYESCEQYATSICSARNLRHACSHRSLLRHRAQNGYDKRCDAVLRVDC